MILLDAHVPWPPLKVPLLALHEAQYAEKPAKVLVKAELNPVFQLPAG